jgi:CRISPR-associated protein Csb3
MTDFVLASADPKTMLSHMALYGLAAIIEDGGIEDVRLSWTAGMTPRPVLSAPEATPETIGEIVRRHAAQHGTPESWPSRQLGEGEQRALMSPRISVITTGEGWRSLQDRRHDVLDQLTDARALLDLRLIAALGEPSYWRKNRKGDRLQDDGASRLEMQPRNQGSEFVGNRIRPLAAAVAARTATEVSDGLTGRRVRDEIGKDQPASRTPTGFAAPGPTDNALAWCALWGISQFPIAQRTTGFALAAGHIGQGTSGYFYLPVWNGRWRTARHRTIVASRQLAQFAATGLSPDAVGRASAADDTSHGEAARRWLAGRSVTAVVRFPVHRFGSDSAPERRAMLGELLKTVAANGRAAVH